MPEHLLNKLHVYKLSYIYNYYLKTTLKAHLRMLTVKKITILASTPTYHIIVYYKHMLHFYRLLL